MTRRPHHPPMVGALALALATLLPGGPAGAHGNAPRVRTITFPAVLGGRPLLLTDTQGMFGTFDAGYRWLCEDAVAPNAALGTIVLGPEPHRMLLSAASGVFISGDGGCRFAPVAGLPADTSPFGLWPHPERPTEILTAVAENGNPHAVRFYLSEDGGQTFAPTAEVAPGVIDSLMRAPDDPDIVFRSSPMRLERSDDGGRTFAALPGELPGAAVTAGIIFLGGRPGTTELWAAAQSFPLGLLLRSADRGESWTVVAELPDSVGSLAFDAEGRRGALATLTGRMARSDDGGETWGPLVEGPGSAFGCLVRGPDAALYACADPFLGAQFAVARSDDFGGQWTPVLTALNEVTQRWDCPDDTPGATACADLCPGRPPGASCALCPAGQDCAAAPDAGAGQPADAGPEVPRDAGPPASADAASGTPPPEADSATSGGCVVRAPEGDRGWAGWAALAALLVITLRRARARRRSA